MTSSAGRTIGRLIAERARAAGIAYGGGGPGGSSGGSGGSSGGGPSGGFGRILGGSGAILALVGGGLALNAALFNGMPASAFWMICDMARADESNAISITII